MSDAGAGPAVEFDDEDPDMFDDAELDADEDVDEEDFLANNPAMQRVQAAYKRQLVRQQTELTEELREKQAQVKDAKRRREDTGVELYGAQQQLAKLQAKVEATRDALSDTNADAAEAQTRLANAKAGLRQLEEQKSEIDGSVRMASDEHARITKALAQLDKLSGDMQNQIRTAMRQADKAAKGEAAAEVTKQEQDLYVDRLQEQLKKLVDKRKILQTQLEAQQETTQEALARVNEAQSEVDAVAIERKEISTQWKASAEGLAKRNEALAMMKAAADEQQQQIFTKQVEIDNLKKMVSKQQDQAEMLELQLSRISSDTGAIQRAVHDTTKKNDKAKSEYSQCVRMLSEAEENLRRVTQQHSIISSECVEQRTKYERLHRTQTNLEDELISVVYDRKTVDRYGKATVKSIQEKKREVLDLELQLSEVENKTSRVALQEQSVKAQIESESDVLKQVEIDLAEKNGTMREYETSSRKNALTATRKESQMSVLKNRIGVIVEQRMKDGAGQVDVTPLQLEREKLQDQITTLVKENALMQQQWLHRQSELVAINKKAEEQAADTEDVNAKLSVLSQKKYRIQREIDANEKEYVTLQRNYADLQRDVVKLDTLLSRNRSVEESMSASNVLMEKEFLRRLKEEELSSIRQQAEVAEVQEEKTRVLNAVVDAERQILQWEKKIQLAEEIKAAIVDPDGEGETAAMKKEIHRMELRLVQLNRQREVLIQDMERAVERRGDINIRAGVAARTKDPNTRTAVQKQLRELNSRVKTAVRDAKNAEAETYKLSQELQQVNEDFQLTREELQSAEDQAQDLEREHDLKREARDRNVTDIVYFQKLQQHVEAHRSKGKPLKKTPEQIRAAIKEQQTMLQNLNNIAEYLADTNPALQAALEPIRQMVSARLAGPPTAAK